MKEWAGMTPDRQILAEHHLPLVRWAVLTYFSNNESVVGLELDDLFQEGCTALCHAAVTYRPGKTAFSTYAVKVIRNHLTSYCRNVSATLKNLPTCSMEAGNSEIAQSSDEYEFENDSISKMCASVILQNRKANYKGAARLGIEALELKVLEGYGVTDIAQMYGTKPNLVGAWISKAAKLMREDLTSSEMEILGVEKIEKIA